ncbi:MAG: AAA family ATPase [candidate division WOR-3 bacterium]
MRELIFSVLEELLEQPINNKLDESETLNYKILYKPSKNKERIILQDIQYPHLLPLFVLELDERGIFRGFYKFSDLRNRPVPYKPFLRYIYKLDKFKLVRTIQPFKNEIFIYYPNGPKFDNENLELFLQKTLFPNDLFENKILIIELFHSSSINKEIFKNFKIMRVLKSFAQDLDFKQKAIINELSKITNLKFKSLIGNERLYSELETGIIYISRIYDKIGYLMHFMPINDLKEFFINKGQQYVLNVFACNSDYSDGTIKSFENDIYLPGWSIGIMHVFEDNLESVPGYLEKFLTVESSFYIRKHTLSQYAKLTLKYKNVILYGPPGTGKTYLALKIASEISRNYTIIQMHPSYSYEDFIEGIRPKSDGGFYIKDGIFKEFCKRALNSSENFVIILDEIGRCNLIQVFGELLYALEYRDKYVILPYSSEKFKVPENVYIIGTMNTVDRSVHSLDIALRRRFIFIEILPDFQVVKNFYVENNYNMTIVDELESLFKFVNELIERKLGKEFLIGHSYFLVEPSEIKNVINLKILPILNSLLSKEDYKLVLNFLNNLKLYNN